MNSNFYSNDYGYENYHPSYSETSYYEEENNAYKYDNGGYNYDHDNNYNNDAVQVKIESEKMFNNLTRQLNELKDENNKKLEENSAHIKMEIEKINRIKYDKCLSIINNYQLSKIRTSALELNLDLKTLEERINNLILSCTKDNIGYAKTWIIDQTIKDTRAIEMIADYMLYRVSIESRFNEKLHILYLLNDLLHYCKRKQNENILATLESIVVPIYMYCSLEISEENKSKLDKVLLLWQNNNYLNADLMEEIKQNRNNSFTYIHNLQNREIEKCKEFEDRDIRPPGKTNEMSISVCISDSKMKIHVLEANFEQMKSEFKLKEENLEVELYQLQRSMKYAEKTPMTFQLPDVSLPPPGFPLNQKSYQNQPTPVNITSIEEPLEETESREIKTIHEKNSPMQDIETVYSPIQRSESNSSSIEFNNSKMPYWKLPTAVMTVQIKLDDYKYRSIDSDSIILPDLKRPSDKLIESVEMFYSQASHDHPRDADGWEKLGLFDFFKLKSRALNKEIPNNFIRNVQLEKFEDDYFDPSVMESSQYASSSNLMHPLPDRTSSSRSLLGTPWEAKSSSSRPAKITPLMSIDIPDKYSRSCPRPQSDFYLDNRRPRNEISSSTGGNFRSSSRRSSFSRSRSRSSEYSRSLSSSRSRSRSPIRSSAGSSYSNDRRQRSDDRSRSRSYGNSPVSRYSNYSTNTDTNNISNTPINSDQYNNTTMRLLK